MRPVRMTTARFGQCALTVLLLLAAATAHGGEQIYYSIQFASFQQLENANRQVNQLSQNEKLVFWKQVDVPGKGIYYRVFLGRFDSREQAEAYGRQLQEKGDFIVRRFTESIPEKTVAPATAPSPAESPVSSATRFIDNRDGTVTDTKTRLMWARNGWMLEFFAAMDWWKARQKVGDLQFAGFDDWRLPRIEEWEGLIDPGREYPALVEPNPFINIITHMPYWSATEYSFTPGTQCSGNCPGHAYTVMLYSGNIQRINKKEGGFVLPVRDISTP